MVLGKSFEEHLGPAEEALGDQPSQFLTSVNEM